MQAEIFKNAYFRLYVRETLFFLRSENTGGEGEKGGGMQPAGILNIYHALTISLRNYKSFENETWRIDNTSKDVSVEALIERR